MMHTTCPHIPRILGHMYTHEDYMYTMCTSWAQQGIAGPNWTHWDTVGSGTKRAGQGTQGSSDTWDDPGMFNMSDM